VSIRVDLWLIENMHEAVFPDLEQFRERATRGNLVPSGVKSGRPRNSGFGLPQAARGALGCRLLAPGIG
jgi:hypothetical protein